MGARGPKARPPIERFTKLTRRSDDGCLEWIGCRDSDGYGYFMAATTPPKIPVRAHRWSYEYHVGPIPDGLYLDHLCRNRACVNPEHLEPVTPRENALRGMGRAAINAEKTHCVNGHPLSGDNLYTSPSTQGRGRICRQCHRDRCTARYQKKKAA